MQLRALTLLLISFSVAGQEFPNPNTVDLVRNQLSRITSTPLVDPAEISRLALRAPLVAGPDVSLAELQSAQTALIRLNDILNADAQRASLDASVRIPPPLTALPAVRPFPLRAVATDIPNLALARPTRQSSVRYYGSRGGVDGRITGTYGFYTEIEPSPWWQVDLGHARNIKEIRVYNSRIFPERARTLKVLVSSGGQSWQTVYTHSGETFGASGAPLRVFLKDTSARWVRLQITGPEYFHLDEIEIY